MLERLPELWTRTGEHLFLTGVAVGVAVAVGIPLGVLALRVRWLRGPLTGALGVLQTIPSLAMLAILLSILGKIGATPAIIALILYALLPIVRNTLTGLEGVPPAVIEAARGVGMTRRQRLWMVRIPLALPVIVAGVQTAAVISVGVATLSAFIGAGGLGEFINRGLGMNNKWLILWGAVPAAILALAVYFSIGATEWALRPERKKKAGTKATLIRALALAAPAALVILGIATALFRPALPSTAAGAAGTVRPVRVGSKEFTEQYVLGELMAQMIERHTGLPVERRFGLGGTMICHAALEKAEIDLYAEYTGTAYQAILHQEGLRDPGDVFRAVRQDYTKRFGAEWLGPFGFNNTYAITVRQADAEARGWRTISDLVPVAGDLQAGFTSEFMERQDGYPGLRKAYGLRFGRTRDLSAALMYEAVAKEQVDVICAFATDGRIAAYDLKPLADDRHFFPPYQAAPVVRLEVLEARPEIRAALAPLAGRLDDAAMQRLNYAVDEQKRDPAEVAREFLEDQGLH